MGTGDKGADTNSTDAMHIRKTDIPVPMSCLLRAILWQPQSDLYQGIMQAGPGFTVSIRNSAQPGRHLVFFTKLFITRTFRSSSPGSSTGVSAINAQCAQRG